MSGPYRSGTVFCRKKWPGPILGMQNPAQSEKIFNKDHRQLGADLGGAPQADVGIEAKTFDATIPG
jgi:hypothetical protein